MLHWTYEKLVTVITKILHNRHILSNVQLLMENANSKGNNIKILILRTQLINGHMLHVSKKISMLPLT